MDTHDEDLAFARYQEGREAYDEGAHERALELLNESLRLSVHFKTLEMIGDVLIHLNRCQEAITPLAASSGLNRGARAPCLLAEAFVSLGDWQSAKEAAEESLRRVPDYGRAKEVLATIEQHLSHECK